MQPRQTIHPVEVTAYVRLRCMRKVLKMQVSCCWWILQGVRGPSNAKITTRNDNKKLLKSISHYLLLKNASEPLTHKKAKPPKDNTFLSEHQK